MAGLGVQGLAGVWIAGRGQSRLAMRAGCLTRQRLHNRGQMGAVVLAAGAPVAAAAAAAAAVPAAAGAT
eukprot:532977-Pelagomonas_calceolata.AAC.5